MSLYSEALEFFVENGIYLNQDQLQELQEISIEKSEAKSLMRSLSESLNGFFNKYKINLRASKIGSSNAKYINKNSEIFFILEDSTPISAKSVAKAAAVGALFGPMASTMGSTYSDNKKLEMEINNLKQLLKKKNVRNELEERLSKVNKQYTFKLKTITARSIYFTIH